MTVYIIVVYQNPDVLSSLVGDLVTIETGRYTNPYTERKNRLCTICLQIENEEHAIFLCRLYDGIRAKYYEIFSRYNVVNEFLNPRNVNDAYTIGSFLRELENIREAFYEDRK